MSSFNICILLPASNGNKILLTYVVHCKMKYDLGYYLCSNIYT